MFSGSTTAVRSATFTNIVGTAYGITRDLENKLKMYSAGGKFTTGDLVLNFDANRYGIYLRYHP
jgi:hypothetical protein